MICNACPDDSHMFHHTFQGKPSPALYRMTLFDSSSQRIRYVVMFGYRQTEVIFWCYGLLHALQIF